MDRINFSFSVAVSGVNAEFYQLFKHGNPVKDRYTLISCLQKLALESIEQYDIRIEDYEVDSVMEKLHDAVRERMTSDAGF